LPCHSAMLDKIITVSPGEVVEDTLEMMKKKNVEYVPVIDKEGKLLGLFSMQSLMKNLLPVSIPVGQDGIQIDMSMRAAPGIAKRLKKVGPLTVGELMERRVNVVYPETPTWEGVHQLVQHGPPLLVVDRDTGVLSGIITARSALEELQRLKDSDQ
jgi:CBS-domain-containing membrane protein